jgi:hypothetical protein
VVRQGEGVSRYIDITGPPALATIVVKPGKIARLTVLASAFSTLGP